MSCQDVIRRLIRQCGREVRFPSQQGEVRFLAYLNPLREQSDKLLPVESGIFHQGKWLLLAPYQDAKEISEGVFCAGEESFVLERTELVYFKNEPAYLWGIAAKAQEEING